MKQNLHRENLLLDALMTCHGLHQKLLHFQERALEIYTAGVQNEPHASHHELIDLQLNAAVDIQE